jgi:low affinity Fe/Cu permease
MNGTSPGWRFSQLARTAARLTGHPSAFLVAVSVILAWAITGPLFGFNDTWQLVINTATTIVTFLMVFLLQNSQNRDTVAMQLKLDELVRSIKAARNTVLNLEELEEHELERLLKKYQKIGSDARRKTIVEPPAAPEGQHEQAPRV